ncbi:S8 family serine peptidase [Micromonospora sp. NBRC 101691]|uniref:S8 family serine peptidase n=1 Tax=Micromonospora sp. NBRC 101691 TaxID=3032198 RepID=UPI0024A2DC27|nr:S8 family serine peptidase [Micromonospora sp. NBRC 101691]GLY24659.1 hypothetical protein Misp04_43910 [Micromonospora sp. NBRC 101691]
MLAKHPTLVRLLAVAAACCLLLATPLASATASTPDNQPYVKFYVVAADYQGAPENLSEIARRFLGSAERSAEIYQLNTGRVQRDGASLTDPTKLNAGWHLVLPWDAAGTGVQYGQLPATPGARPGPSRPGRPGPPDPGASPSPSPTPSPSRTGRPGGGGTERCTATSASSSKSNWAQLRLAADGAWGSTRGNGIMVAVVDSGVDAAVTQLSGRVAVGADVTVGNGRGDMDCLGSGTAMAGLIGADASTKDTPVGLAPDATILPVRMIRNTGTGRPADAANAIEVAVSAGASVVALGSYVDLTDPTVAASIATALGHDVLVVAGAPTKPFTPPSPPDPDVSGALLLVGGVGPDNQLAEKYQEKTVEVVAPGVDVAGLGVAGSGVVSNTGSHVAVAFVAGQAALVRAAYPDLTAIQVEQRILGTADALGDGVPDARYGHGMINPGVSVARTMDDGSRVAAGRDGVGGAALAVVLALALIVGGAVVFWLRNRRRAYAG